MFYVSLFLWLFCVAVSMAEVKKEFGEFRINHSDSISNSLSIQRIYSSRSLFKGVFGFNWCTQLDYRLNISTNEITVFDCDRSKFLSFKKHNKNGSGSQKEEKFKNSDTQLEIIKSNYSYQLETNHTTFHFSETGQLSHWVPNGKPAIYIIYKNNQASQLLIKTMGPQQVTMSSNGLIKTIGNHLNYDYAQGVLKTVRQGGKIVWRYEYDEFLNMTLWRSAGHYELMKYDSEWDRIVYLKDKSDCRFHYDYQVKDAKKFIRESEKCINTLSQETLFEVISPRLIVKSPSDLLDKEFRIKPTRTGANHVETF